MPEAASIDREEIREASLFDSAGLPVNANASVLVASLLAFSGGGRLCGLSVYNSNASTRYVQLFDTVDLPAEGAVPLLVWQLPTLSTLSEEWQRPRVFHRACWIVNSSTAATKTLSGADFLIDVQYV